MLKVITVLMLVVATTAITGLMQLPSNTMMEITAGQEALEHLRFDGAGYETAHALHY